MTNFIEWAAWQNQPVSNRERSPGRTGSGRWQNVAEKWQQHSAKSGKKTRKSTNADLRDTAITFVALWIAIGGVFMVLDWMMG